MSAALSSELAAHLAAGTAAALVVVAEVRGSTPREAGAAMLVTENRVAGTVGGGRFEWEAIAEARKLLDLDLERHELAIPLGPGIGQCCGGHVTLLIERATADTLERLASAEAMERAAYPVVLIFGAGHVGKALATALSLLPFSVRLIDSRPEGFSGFEADGVTIILTDCTLVEVEAAPANAAYVVMTHSHSFDALIASAVLERGDFGYLGIIGSHSKRKRFTAAFLQQGVSRRDIARIVCPIGGSLVRDKRPAVIAALTAAELVRVFGADAASTREVA